MQGAEIFAPFFGMLLLTFAVWVLMYVRRITFMTSNRIAAQRLTTAEKAAQIIPEEVSYAAHNLRNLFELPIVFYTLCLYLYVSGEVDAVYVMAGWVFLGFRILHSVIHCSKNIVILRFQAYMASALVLWFMVLRAVLQFFS